MTTGTSLSEAMSGEGGSILASFLGCPPTQAKGAFGWYKEWLSNQRQAAPWDL